MRVLFVSNYYPPYEVGGYEQLCRDVVERFQARGHKVAVLTSDRGVTSQTVAMPGVYRVLRRQMSSDSWLPFALQFFLVRRAAHRHNLRYLDKIVQLFQPEVVFCWNLQGLPLSIAIAAEGLPKVTVAYWLAGYTPAEPDEYWRYWAVTPKKHTYLSWLKQRVAGDARARMRREGGPLRPQMRHVAVVSEYMRRKGITEGTLPEHAGVIYNGVEVKQFFQPVKATTLGALRLLLAGRVTPDKGIHTAIAAMAQLREQAGLSDIHLTVAGSGPNDYLVRLRKQVDGSGLTGQITFTGWIPREQMPNLIKTHHGLILASEHPEAFARVVLEGMAAGLVVIAALTGGTGEIVHEGKTGLTFPGGDSTALASQIKRLHDSVALRQQLAHTGQDLVCEHFSLAHMVDSLEAFLRRAMQEDRAV